MEDIVKIFAKTSKFAINSKWKTEKSSYQSISARVVNGIESFDLGIITSTIDEFEELQDQIGNLTEYETDLDDSTLYYTGQVESKKGNCSVIVPYPIAMGIEGSVCNTTKIINSFHPKYLFMVGVCAGNKNVTKIGDIIIAEKSINYNNVVEINKAGGITQKKYMQSADSINKNLKAKLSRFFTKDKLNLIKQSDSDKTLYDNNINKHIGLMVTGSSLVRSDEKIKEINDSYHDVKGMDMETNGFYFTASHSSNTIPKFVSIKGVSDFGNSTNHKIKNIDRKRYALKNGVMATLIFIQEEV